MTADEQAGAEVRQHDHSEQHIERLNDVVSRSKRRCDDEQQRNQIEYQQGIAELMSLRGAPFVKEADSGLCAPEGNRFCSHSAHVRFND